MKRLIRTTAAALVMASMSACGSSDAPPAGSSRTQYEVATNQAVAGAQVIDKKIGEEGGWACPGEDNSACAVVFTVTSISAVPMAACSETSHVPRESKLYKVAMDVAGQHPTPEPNSHIPPGFVVASDNWYALGSDGYSTKAETAIGCGDYTPGPFYDFVNVGEKQRGTLIFAVPQNTTALQIRQTNGPTWQFQV